MGRDLFIGTIAVGIWWLLGLALAFVYFVTVDDGPYDRWAETHPGARLRTQLLVNRLYNWIADHAPSTFSTIIISTLSPILTPLGFLEIYWWFLWYWRGRLLHALGIGDVG